MTQEGRESYEDEAAAGTTSISQNSGDFIEAATDIDATRAEESVVRARSQRAGKFTEHATGIVVEREEGKNRSMRQVNALNRQGIV